MKNKNHSILGQQVILAAWLAVFCLFGYRATFSVLLGPLQDSTGWTVSQVSLGYSLMMMVYAITAFFSGIIIDRWGTRPAYMAGAIFGALGFLCTSMVQSYLAYLFSYALFAGIGTGMLWVSSTISVRKWYTGSMYAQKWGLAFMGAPVAQVLLSLGVGTVLTESDWRTAMQIMALIVFLALMAAALLAKRDPEYYGIEPFGKQQADSGDWTLKEAFKKKAVWGAILAFLTSLVGEFLIWTQVVNFWVHDVGHTLSTATNLYIIIGLAGIVTMPLMGKLADQVVSRHNLESRGRKIMLIIGPLCGVLACLLLLLSSMTILAAVLATILFAIYWAIEPGGVAGYTGAVYGRATLGKIWGLATLICMGIGPALGTFMGGFLFDLSKGYTLPILFACGAFLLSTLLAALLPLEAKKQ